MALINIGESFDPFYRYKRPKSICDYNNGKTTIVNIEEIAKALHTKASYIIYYIQLYKSTPTNKNEIKAVIPQTEIEGIINDYIEKYILCSVCRYPELVIHKNKKDIEFRCQACGNTMPIEKNKFTKIIYKDY